MSLLRVCLFLAELTGFELDVLSMPESEPRLIIVQRKK